jgi:uncharacterized protein (UPF0261 family)
MGTPAFTPDIPREEVVKAAVVTCRLWLPVSIRMLHANHGSGLAVLVEQLYTEGRLDGILVMGGTAAPLSPHDSDARLPVGVPKLMVSTIGGGDVSPYAGAKDITFMPSIVDVAGFNSISQAFIPRCRRHRRHGVQMKAPAVQESKPLITASMFGNTTTCVDHARAILEAQGYEVLVFHATAPVDGRWRDSSAMVHCRVSRYHHHGARRRGLWWLPQRGTGTRTGSVGRAFLRCRSSCVDMANFGGIETVPEKYRGAISISGTNVPCCAPMRKRTTAWVRC